MNADGVSHECPGQASILAPGHGQYAEDSGKSTTSGRLVFELGGLPEPELEKLAMRVGSGGPLKSMQSFYAQHGIENYCFAMRNTLQEEKLQDKFEAASQVQDLLLLVRHVLTSVGRC